MVSITFNRPFFLQIRLWLRMAVRLRSGAGRGTGGSGFRRFFSHLFVHAYRAVCEECDIDSGHKQSASTFAVVQYGFCGDAEISGGDLSLVAAMQYFVDGGDDFRVVDLSHAIETGGHVVWSEEDAVESGYGDDVFDAGDGVSVFSLDNDDDFIVGIADVIAEPSPVTLSASDADSAPTQRRIAGEAYDVLSGSWGIDLWDDNPLCSCVEDAFDGPF